MFQRFVVVAILLLGIPAAAYAQGDRWIVVGATYGGIVGDGTASNKFDLAPGGYFEYGVFFSSHWGATIAGTSFSPTKNHVGSHSASATFYAPYYGDVRWRPRAGRPFTPFVAFGMGWQRMHFEGTQGADNQGVFSAGAGFQLRLTNKGVILQVLARPYAIASNDLGQSTGFDVQVGVGRSW